MELKSFFLFQKIFDLAIYARINVEAIISLLMAGNGRCRQKASFTLCEHSPSFPV
jgi:hypothetical protein